MFTIVDVKVRFGRGKQIYNMKLALATNNLQARILRASRSTCIAALISLIEEGQKQLIVVSSACIVTWEVFKR